MQLTSMSNHKDDRHRMMYLNRISKNLAALAIACLLSIGAQSNAFAAGGETPLKVTYPFYPPAPKAQSQAEADGKSDGCMTCHTSTDRHTMHSNPGVILGCTDCHGGNSQVRWQGGNIYAAKAEGGDKKADKKYKDKKGKKKDGKYKKAYKKYSTEYRESIDSAHVQPTLPETWHYPSSANPPHAYTILNTESPEYVRFVNPGDYRIAEEACGACHLPIIKAAKRSLMSTGCLLYTSPSPRDLSTSRMPSSA